MLASVMLEAVESRKLADFKLSNDQLDEADQLLSEADVHLDTLLAPPLERGLFYMSKFTLARKRWKQSPAENEKEMSRACFYLDKALKVFHRRFPAMAAKAVKEAALFGDEMGNKRVRNVAATILYTMPLKREEEEANDEGEEGGKEGHGTAEETEEDEQKQQMLKNEEEEEVDQNLCPPIHNG
ncbi:hypothetical protein niasHT_018528 [Heterodera trifolii]|uniref:Uncharacterized protein n=1 Tax=Heterodera trifolii TaxID=157864 RepID=A0ABD2LCK8_9BILA